MFNKLKLAIFMVAIVSATISGQALATTSVLQDDSSSEITISPTSNKISLDPGSNYSGSMMILNSGKQEFTAKVYVKPYQVANSSYDPRFEDQTARTQISRWIKLESDTYTLQADESVEVKYTVDVPKDTPSGGQYAVIFAEVADSNVKEGSNGVEVKKRVGMLLYATVNGDTREDGQIIKTSMPWLFISKPIGFDWSIKNTGNTDFYAKYSMSVSGLFGDEIYKNDKQSIVLPDTTRDIAMEWGAQAGDENTSKPPVFGLYKAKFTYSFLDQTEQKEQFIFVASWTSILILLVVILAIAVAVVFVVRRKRR